MWFIFVQFDMKNWSLSKFFDKRWMLLLDQQDGGNTGRHVWVNLCTQKLALLTTHLSWCQMWTTSGWISSSTSLPSRGRLGFFCDVCCSHIDSQMWSNCTITSQLIINYQVPVYTYVCDEYDGSWEWMNNWDKNIMITQTIGQCDQ